MRTFMTTGLLLCAIISLACVQVQAQLGCSQYTNTITLSTTPSVSVSYVSTSTAISMQLKTSRQAWIGVGRSQSGGMVGSEAVIGLPSTGAVGYYLLDNKFLGAGGVYTSAAVTLSGTSITQSPSNGTVLKFTQKLTDGRFPLSSTGTATFIYAIGCSNTLGVHCLEDSFPITLSPCVTTGRPSKKPTRKPSIRKPTRKPSRSRKPTRKPSRRPSRKPISKPSRRPSKKPMAKPSRRPSRKPTRKPSKRRTKKPTRRPL